MYRGKIKNIHFIGIGGSGMSGIAEVLVNLGYNVSGSDIASGEKTDMLASIGATVFIGHRESNIKDAHCVVYSSAVPEDNPEIVAASELNIPIIPRAEMLAELMRMKYGIAIAGTHGKTTTTSIIGAVLAEGGIDPTIVTGGKLNSIGTNAKLGSGEFLVAEADESDGSFLKLSPVIGVVTNIDKEHMEHYGDMETVKAAYVEFMNKVPFYGCNIVCIDHPTIQSLLPLIKRRVITYGFSSQADVYGEDIEGDGARTSFTLWVGDKSFGKVTVNIPGEHNVYNSLAAIAVAVELGIDIEDIKKALSEFSGVERRFQVKGISGDVIVVDDYGHHPVEIKAVLKAAKDGWKRRIVAVFQPHRYTRTEDLFEEFTTAFNDSDKLILTDIYSAGEKEIKGVSAKKLYQAIKTHGHKDVSFVGRLDKVGRYLLENTKAGDIIITLGAGNVKVAGEEFLRLKKALQGDADLKVVNGKKEDK